ncbi:hypothetical protein roselon_01903 [Roseibacterium elongatum DSM 19469]|uniref:Uncharacterized protein n=1 Tax=Roseicyclus elongatus DSM 19469 TaxID=1294273 RepID=W8S237_9RHOB|nr:DUF167 family protein [Roseibacterium elongatum]AHM04262.1 hypothetical protein roselon_01903 [Roseibacterium elongatum DSM 19469]
MACNLSDLACLAVDRHEIALRVTPKAARDRIARDADGRLPVHVIAPPDKGAAKAAALRLLAKAMRVPRARLSILRRGHARDKVVRVD